MNSGQEIACPDLIELERYVLRELDDAAVASIAEHISRCSECAAEIDQLGENLKLAPALRRANRDILSPQFSPPSDPQTIGPYRILRKLGQGGMGSVYEAQQENPRRVVALKVIRPGLVSTTLLSRFRREAQVLGRLRHPGIAQIYEAGTHRDPAHGTDWPYFVMERVSGLPLIEYADAKKLGIAARLELVAKACDAVQHAHQQGVVHRDLKPDNILVDDSAGEPCPKILDFGVARVVDPDGQTTVTTLQTDVGQIVGTVAYMSPEQASGNPLEIDTRTDVHALGVICFQLLCGQLPYKVSKTTIAETVRAIVQDEPTPLASIDRTLRGDVTTIVGKALEKERSRRYQTAGEMAADIRRFLRHEPITAHPPSTVYQLRKFAQRNKGLVAGIVATMIVLVLGVIGTTIGMVRAQRSAADAKSEAAKQEAVTEFLQEMLSSADPRKMTAVDQLKGRGVMVLDVLDQAAARIEAGSFKNQPEIETTIRKVIGDVYRELGEYDKSARHLEIALDNSRRFYGPENFRTADCLNALAIVRRGQGKFAEAESLNRQALATARRTPGLEDPRAALYMNCLALVLQDEGKLDEAQQLFEQCLALRRKLFGDQSADVATSLNSLGSLLIDRRRFEQAEPLLREALTVRRTLLGDEHPDVAVVLNNLAILLRAQGKLADAEPMFRQALEIRRKTLGEQHRTTIGSLNNLASVLHAEGKTDEAGSLYRQALEMNLKIAGEVNPLSANLVNNLGTVLLDEKKFPEAEDQFRRSLAIRRKLYGENHPAIARALHNVAGVLRIQGKYADAQALSEQAVAIATQTLGPDHDDTAAYRSLLGAILTNLGRYPQAEQELLAAHQVLQPRLKSGYKDSITTVKRLTELYQQWNKPQEAQTYAAMVPSTRPARAP